MRMLSKISYLTMIGLLFGVLIGCADLPGQHKVDVRQGNYLDENRIARLQIGMTKAEVQLLIGTPLLHDPYHPDTWHYVYILHKAGGTLAEHKKMVLTFQNDRLSRIE